MERFKDSVAIVTGGVGGIGYAIVEALLKEGARVAIVDCQDDSDALKKLGGLQRFGGSFRYFRTDIVDSAAVDTMVGEVSSVFAKIDLLVNNAGITRDNLILRLKDEDFRKVLNINLEGAFYLTRATARIMIKAKRGAIVNISSVVATKAGVGQANYAASKAGIEALTRAAAIELSSRNIRVNAIAPGAIDTPMTRELMEKRKDDLLQYLLIKRFGTAEEIAKVVLFLASDDASYITGQVIYVDGGFKLA